MKKKQLTSIKFISTYTITFLQQQKTYRSC